ncbi:MAG: hypothetical protein H6865_02135 [Rhodospirillales bacterium]|nr:hypothetical protein [Alphaproteobacteria bacterium]MCB9986415.1 hypothetical protein [Rhodospirillales bacterium]USO07039.1 MAG: hypothetical protein H6866_06250 [Rhodospirillales bacterium]
MTGMHPDFSRAASAARQPEKPRPAFAVLPVDCHMGLSAQDEGVAPNRKKAHILGRLGVFLRRVLHNDVAFSRRMP